MGVGVPAPPRRGRLLLSPLPMGIKPKVTQAHKRKTVRHEQPCYLSSPAKSSKNSGIRRRLSMRVFTASFSDNDGQIMEEKEKLEALGQKIAGGEIIMVLLDDDVSETIAGIAEK